MSDRMDPFNPVGASTKTATSASGTHALPGGAVTVEKTIRVCRQASGSRVWIWFHAASSFTLTSTVGMELITGAVEMFEVPASVQFFSIITDTGSVDVNVTVGQGL